MSWHRPNAPSGPITSPFGPRGPIANAPDASRYHLGVDLRAGTLGVTSDIYAAAAGTVRRIYKTVLGAWVLELDHGGMVRTRYAHMQRAGIAVAVGAKVAGGQRIAAASNSGAPTIHLHFEVLLNGTQVDPVPYLRARGIDLTTTTIAKPGASTGSITSPTIPGRPAPLTPEDDMTAEFERDVRAALAEQANQITDIQNRVYSMHALNYQGDPRRGIPGGTLGFLDQKLAATCLAIVQGTTAAIPNAIQIDPGAIRKSVHQGLSDALSGIETTITVKGA